MNKTVTINISGIIFHIEEDAYNTLSKYLLTLKGYFSKADGGNEIMSDIESRIAEMLQSKTSAIKQVVLMADVDFVMESMGKPEEFGGETSDSNTIDNDFDQTDNATNDVKKRLYRDGDSKVLGGVCSGIGHYFGFDPVWLRIALALLLVFAGTGVLIYIILWIAIPEAKTTTEKLAMKGEKADINNISKAVKEEAEHLKRRMEKYGNEFKNMTNSNRDVPRNGVEKIVDFITDILMNIGRVLLKISGIALLIIGVFLFLLLFGFISGASIVSFDLGAEEWINLFLLDGKDFYLGIIGIAIFVGIPVIMMINGGIRILFKLKYRNRWINLSAGIIWLFGFLILLYVGIRTGKDFSKDAKVRESISIKPYDTLYLKMNELPINFDEISENENDEDENDKTYHHHRKRSHNDYMIGKNNNVKYLLGHAQLNIIKSQSDAIELIIVKEAKGGDRKDASDRSKNIAYKVTQLDSIILFDNIFKVNNADKFRVQNVKVIFKIPVGKVVYLDKSLEFMLNDVDNITNTYDSDMINRRWIMTEKGLKCIDCKDLDTDYNNDVDNENDTESSSNNDNVKITVNGVDIKAKNSQVKLDSNGVKINSKNTKLTIDEKGIHIDTDKKK